MAKMWLAIRTTKMQIVGSSPRGAGSGGHSWPFFGGFPHVPGEQEQNPGQIRTEVPSIRGAVLRSLAPFVREAFLGFEEHLLAVE